MRETYIELDKMMPVILEQLAAGGAVRFTPQGISMRPMLEGGRDQVVLSPVPEKLKKYDLPLYRREDGKYVLHRIVKAGESYSCVGDNQYVYEDGLRHDQMLAVVSAFVRKGKEYSTEDFGYKVYCRFWHYSRPIRYFAVRCINFIKRRVFKK